MTECDVHFEKVIVPIEDKAYRAKRSRLVQILLEISATAENELDRNLNNEISLKEAA